MFLALQELQYERKDAHGAFIGSWIWPGYAFIHTGSHCVEIIGDLWRVYF